MEKFVKNHGGGLAALSLAAFIVFQGIKREEREKDPNLHYVEITTNDGKEISEVVRYAHEMSQEGNPRHRFVVTFMDGKEKTFHARDGHQLGLLQKNCMKMSEYKAEQQSADTTAAPPTLEVEN